MSALITPLRLIFWGALLCLLDFHVSQTTNGQGFKFDFLNDFLGMILITVGVFRLSRQAPTPSAARAMNFVKIVAVVSTIKALIDHTIFQAPEPWTFFWTLFALAELAANVIFCFSMILYCNHHGLPEPARSWRTTAWLFVVIYALPLGLFYVAALIAMLAGESFNLNLGPAFLLVLAVLVIPIIHFFVSTSRTARAAASV